MRFNLKGANVYRAGVTARSMAHETCDVDLENGQPRAGVSNVFTLTSKGGGTTSVRYVNSAQDYMAHLQLMVQNDRNAALAAMSEIMREEMVLLPEREAKVAQAARNEIVTRASNRWSGSYGTEEAVASIVYEGVKEIVAAVENPETPEEAGTV